MNGQKFSRRDLERGLRAAAERHVALQQENALLREENARLLAEKRAFLAEAKEAIELSRLLSSDGFANPFATVDDEKAAIERLKFLKNSLATRGAA